MNKESKIIKYLIFEKNKIKINTNDIYKGDVFLSLRGSKSHGNKYIDTSIVNKVKFIITDNKNNLPKNKNNILIVKNTYEFLLKIANKKRNLYKGKIIGITGSVGKTTVKENLKFFLSKVSSVSASIKSYNNFLGVLISLINMNLKSKFSIFEIGTNNFNEIQHLTSIVKPQQMIITNINPTHLQNFLTTNNIAKEKADIFNTKFNPNGDLLIIPDSNNDELSVYKKAIKMKIPNIIRIGNNSYSDFQIKKITAKKNYFIVNTNFKKNTKEFRFKSNQYYEIYNIMLCFLIFKFNKLKISSFNKLINKVPKVEGRGIEKKVKIGNHKLKFFDESYNASPKSMDVCINYFSDMKINSSQKKFLILGDMNELGKDSKKYHINIIKKINKSNFDYTILCGEIFKKALKDVQSIKKTVIHLINERKIINFLKKNIHNNDILLIKGSNSTKVNNLAKIINYIKE